PYPIAYRLFTTNTATPESSYLRAGGGNIDYYSAGGNFIWPTNVNYHYFSVGASAATLGAYDTSPLTARKFFDLPGVEFDTRGYPTFNSTNLTFIFAEKKNTNNYYEVVIDSTVGIPRLIGPSGP
ncbi:MAG: hypothetical protein WCD79_18960, partial [Chthoniobacteraceae bacterium]